MSHDMDEGKDNTRKSQRLIGNALNDLELGEDMLNDKNLDTLHKETLAFKNARQVDSTDKLQDELKEKIVVKEKKNK